MGKWPIVDLAFGINYLMRKHGTSHVASVYAGIDCIQLKGPQVIGELNSLLRLLTLCMLFSKKPFPVFLESAGYSQEEVLLQSQRQGIKDTPTAATGAVVPCHHLVLHDGGISNLILGYAHCGMVAAARWIAKLSTPCLLQSLGEYPDYNVTKEFSSCTCLTFAPAACMTWDLTESGKHFITTLINGSDLVPTFSAASVDDLRSEVTASSWLNDLRDQVEHTRVLNVVYRSATALGSR